MLNAGADLSLLSIGMPIFILLNMLATLCIQCTRKRAASVPAAQPLAETPNNKPSKSPAVTPTANTAESSEGNDSDALQSNMSTQSTVFLDVNGKSGNDVPESENIDKDSDKKEEKKKELNVKEADGKQEKESNEKEEPKDAKAEKGRDEKPKEKTAPKNSTETKQREKKSDVANKKDSETKMKEEQELKKKGNDANKEPQTDKDCQLNPTAISWNKQGGQQIVKFSNPTREVKAIKVKCSDNKVYTINPVFTKVPPGDSVEIVVTRVPAPMKKDKVIVAYAKCPEKEKNISNFFKTTPATAELTINMTDS